MEQEQVSIKIDGKTLPAFTTFILDQPIQAHHSFELAVGHDIAEGLDSDILDNSQKWVGKTLESRMGDNRFSGVVTSVRMEYRHGPGAHLVVRGHSPTIFLEAGPHNRSWNDSTLQKIAEDVLGGVAKVPGAINPKFKPSVGYLSQYKETHFEFLRRLAGTYHEWLFYDGQKLCFGKPADLPKVPVVYGVDLDRVELTMQMAPVNFEGYAYNSRRDEFFRSLAGGRVEGLDEMGYRAFLASEAAYSTTKSPVLPDLPDKWSLDNHMADTRASKAACLSVVSGGGTAMNLRPGVVAVIKAAVRKEGKWTDRPQGNYLVTHVRHHATGNHGYSNHFEAIPARLGFLPPPDFRMPVAESQVATVTANDDPDGQGRVQVQMLWQGDTSMKSPWIRVLTPDGGSSDLVGTNRGFVFIPEVGDQVMVGFRYNDPSRPYVIGSLFHGLSGGGGGGANATKSITTRSGATITLNDNEGAGSITLSDPSGNKVVLKGDGTMEITAPNRLDIRSTEIKISASKDITTSAGMNITTTAGMNITTAAGMNIAESAGMGIESMASLNVAMIGGKGVNISAGGGSSLGLSSKGTASLASKKKIEIDSGNILDMAGKSKTNIKGKTIEITGKSKAELKAGKVELS